METQPDQAQPSGRGPISGFLFRRSVIGWVVYLIGLVCWLSSLNLPFGRGPGSWPTAFVLLLEVVVAFSFQSADGLVGWGRPMIVVYCLGLIGSLAWLSREGRAGRLGWTVRVSSIGLLPAPWVVEYPLRGFPYHPCFGPLFLALGSSMMFIGIWVVPVERCQSKIETSTASFRQRIGRWLQEL